MRTVKFKPGQTVFDIALQEYGNIEGIAFIAEDNDISLDEADQDDEVFVRTEVVDKRVKDYFKNKSIVSI